MPQDIRVLIYEDNHDLRDTLAGLIRFSEGFELAGGFDNCVQIAKQVDALWPDVILMDIDMPGMSGIEGVRLARKSRPDVNIIMLTVFDDNGHLFDALCAGANGYLLKQTPPAQILDACREVHQGGAPMSPAIARQVLGFLPRARHAAQEQYQLTNREVDLLSLLVKGFSYKMIAAERGISIDTVRGHIRSIYSKLHVNSATEAVSKALRDRLV